MFALLLVAFGCKKDESGDPTPDYLLEINVDADNTSMFEDVEGVYVWLTASNGDIIADTVLTPGAQIKLERPEGFTDERFSYHVLTYKSNGDYGISSYMSIKPGVVNYEKYSNDRGEKTGEVTLSFVDIPEYDWYLFDVGGGSFSSSGQLNSFTTSVYENVDWFYISLWNQSSRYYQFIDNIEAGTAQTVSLGNMKTDFTEHKISFDKSGYNGVESYAYSKESYKGRSTRLGSTSESLTAPASLSVFVPAVDERFKSFSYNLYCSPDNSGVGYGYSSYGSVPTAMKYIAADIELVTFSLNTQEFNITGEFDYAGVYFGSYQDGISSSWWRMDETGANIEFPALPERVKTKYSNISKEQIINNNTYWSVSLSKADNTSNYDETIDLALNRSGKTWNAGITESLYTYLGGYFNGKKAGRDDYFNAMNQRR